MRTPALLGLSLLALTLAGAAGACGSGESSGSGGGGGSGGATASGPASGPGPTSATTASGSPASTGAGGNGGSGPVAPIHFIGRWDMSDPKHPVAAWPGSAIYARFTGTGADLAIDDGGDNYLTVVIDDGAPSVVHSQGQSMIPVASGLADGEHSVWIEKITESYQGTLTYNDLTATGGKPVLMSPAPYKRFIEIVGDSITCGYGDTGTCNCGGQCCSFTPDTEDEFLAYGAVTARNLSAAHAGISYSGIGIYRDYGGNTQNQMPVKYERTFADDANSKWTFDYTPDVVVINLGTNDFAAGDPGQPYVDAMTGFVKQVRMHYPNAFIVLAVGSMLGDPQHTTVLGYLQMAIANVGDGKVSTADLGIQPCDNNLGCDYHPSVGTQQDMADKLTAHIKMITGW